MRSAPRWRRIGSAGSGLDVLEVEPPSPDDPLLHRDDVIVTPHAAFYSEESLRELQRKAVEQVIEALAGRTPPYAVNADAAPEVEARSRRRTRGPERAMAHQRAPRRPTSIAIPKHASSEPGVRTPSIVAARHEPPVPQQRGVGRGRRDLLQVMRREDRRRSGRLANAVSRASISVSRAG